MTQNLKLTKSVKKVVQIIEEGHLFARESKPSLGFLINVGNTLNVTLPNQTDIAITTR